MNDRPGTPWSPPEQAGWTPPPTAPASARSQVAVFATCSIALAVMSAPGGFVAWGVASILSLAIGIGVGTAAATELDRRFERMAGALYAFVTAMVTGVLVMLVWITGIGQPPAGIILLVTLIVLGLDWRRVDRLRPLPFASGFLVVFGVAAGDGWALPVALRWLLTSFVALTLLGADRRAAQPIVEPIVGSTVARDVARQDLLTTVLVALAVAVVAALLLSTPSCQSMMGRNRSGGHGQGSGQGQGQGEGRGSGRGQGPGEGQGSADHRYVPDRNGDYLVPDDGTSTRPDGSGDRIPIPGSHDELRPGETVTEQDGDGGTRTYRRRSDGDMEVTVRRPGAETKRYVYREEPGGMTRIDQYGADGKLERRYHYDPQGRLATTEPQDSPPPDPPKPDPPKRHRDIDVKLILIVLGVLAALAGLAAWLVVRSRRPAPPAEPPAPPWVLQLARDLEREGRARGCGREGAETFVAYGRRLHEEAFPDPRVGSITTVLSDALYSRRDPGPEVEVATRARFDEMVADHPVPDRSRVRRTKA